MQSELWQNIVVFLLIIFFIKLFKYKINLYDTSSIKFVYFDYQLIIFKYQDNRHLIVLYFYSDLKYFIYSYMIMLILNHIWSLIDRINSKKKHIKIKRVGHAWQEYLKLKSLRDRLHYIFQFNTILQYIFVLELIFYIFIFNNESKI